jgi:hypothetical protein
MGNDVKLTNTDAKMMRKWPKTDPKLTRGLDILGEWRLFRGVKCMCIIWLAKGWGWLWGGWLRGALGVLIPWPGLRNRNCDRNSQKHI